MTTNSPHEQDPSPGVDHPSRPGWGDPTGHDLNRNQLLALRMRFADTDVNVDSMVRAINMASLRSAMHRQVREMENIVHLHLTPAENAEHLGLIGEPERIGDHVRWFGHVALRSFTHPNPNRYQYNPKRTTLELVSRLQKGDWNTTAALDDTVKYLPHQLLAADGTLQIEMLPSDQRPKSYLLLPEYDFGPDQTSGAYRQLLTGALLYRRRAVATVRKPGEGGWTLDVVKESVAVPALNRMPLRIREVVEQSCGVPPGGVSHYRPTDDDVPARAIGAMFELAASETRQKATNIVPISAEYLMVMQNPLQQAA